MTHRTDRTDEAAPSVAVYRRTFLPPSETFVRDHLLNLRRYRPTAVTSYRRDDALEVPGVSVVVADDRRLTARVRRRLPARLRSPLLEREERGLAQVLGRVRPDVLHAHFGTDGAVAVGAARRVGLPSVVTFHGYDATVRPDVMGRTAVGRLLLDRWQEVVHGPTRLIAVSTSIRDELVTRGADPAAIHVVPCGVDPDRFTFSEVDPDGRLVFVGRLVEKKGLADLLHALSARSLRRPLDVIGDGPLRAELEDLVHRLDLDVRFLGAQSSEVVRATLRTASVVVMPSRRAADGDTEGMPVTSVEAGASGRPVVGYAHSGLRDSVLTGRTGELVPEGDVAALGEALDRLLDDPGRLRAYGSAARAHVVAHFDVRATSVRIEAVYDDARAQLR